MARVLTGYTVQTVLQGLFTVWAVMTFTFILIRQMPSNPVEIETERLIREQQLSYDEARSRAAALFEFDPNQPILEQYVEYLGKLIRLDLGKSITSTGTQVLDQILQYLPWTLFSVGLGLLISFTIGIFVGMAMAYWRGGAFDNLVTAFASILFGIPNYIIALLIIVSVVTPFIMPYNEAIRLWRGGEDIWGRYPRNAAPAWQNWFTSTDVSNTIILDSADGDGNVTIEQLSADTREAHYSFEFDFPYDTFPPEVSVFASATYDAKQPFVEMTWITPDGREIRAGELTASANTSFRFNQDDRLQRRLERETGIDGVSVVEGLFDDPAQEGLQVLQGTYRLDSTALLFEAIESACQRLLCRVYHDCLCHSSSPYSCDALRHKHCSTGRDGCQVQN